MRRNHNNQSTFKKIAALAMGMASLGMSAPKANSTALEGNNTTQQQSKKDAIQEKHTPVRPMSVRSQFHGFSNANPYKHIITPPGNQRQKRKYLRQNPNLRNSRKNPL